MDKKTFYSAMKELIPNAPDLAIDQYYKHFDNDENVFFFEKKKWLFRGLLIFVNLSVDCPSYWKELWNKRLNVWIGGWNSKIFVVAFFCYDLDGNGYLTREELQHWVKSVFYTGINLTDSMMQSLGIEMKKKRFSKSIQFTHSKWLFFCRGCKTHCWQVFWSSRYKQRWKNIREGIWGVDKKATSNYFMVSTIINSPFTIIFKCTLILFFEFLLL